MPEVEIVEKEKNRQSIIFDVTVSDQDATTHHVVTLDLAYYRELTQDKVSPEELVLCSFFFLFEKEDRENILRTFNIRDIAKYFPDYENAIRTTPCQTKLDDLVTEGLLLIDKPKGVTSFDVIRTLRKRLNIQKMGHAGTLDPLATGLLLVGVGSATKQLATLVGLSKVYEVDILLGVKTTTGDMEGDVVDEMEVLDIDKARVEKVFHNMVGVVPLKVPLFSAIKIKGKALYAYARKGKAEDISLPVKEMKIFSIELLGVRSVDEQGKNAHTILSVRMHVGSGAYVRSIAEEIGRQLDIPATVYDLRRTRIGDKKLSGLQFDIAEADKIQ